MRVILDTNIWISLMIGHNSQLIGSLLRNPHITVLSCPELMEEICKVAVRDKFKRWITESHLADTLKLINLYSEFHVLLTPAVSEIRDVKDLYLLTLAEQAKADFIVSGDKDVLVLERHKDTLVLTFAAFNNLIAKTQE